MKKNEKSVKNKYWVTHMIIDDVDYSLSVWKVSHFNKKNATLNEIYLKWKKKQTQVYLNAPEQHLNTWNAKRKKKQQIVTVF